MEIRRVVGGELDQVLTVLNDATLDLLEKGIHQWSYPWDSSHIKDEIERGACYVIVLDAKIICTFFINEIDVLSEVLIPTGSLYLSKIALLPEYQGRHLGTEVIHFAFNYAKMGNKSLFLDCWAGNEKLKAFYSKNGFNYLGDYPEEDYFISVYRYN